MMWRQHTSINQDYLGIGIPSVSRRETKVNSSKNDHLEGEGKKGGSKINISEMILVNS